jgi:hypothetical protein
MPRALFLSCFTSSTHRLQIAPRPRGEARTKAISSGGAW